MTKGNTNFKIKSKKKEKGTRLLQPDLVNHLEAPESNITLPHNGHFLDKSDQCAPPPSTYLATP